MPQLAPFRLRPWFRTRIWGARSLAPWYAYAVGDEPIGEVWLSGDDCIVDSGPLAGTSFAHVFAEHRHALLGEGAEHHAARFPLLMKVLFPQEKLSVQVHPDDALAMLEGEPHGKTECWYALEATPEAKVALGFLPGVTPPDIQRAIDDQTLESLLNWISVSKGDMIFVDAGTVHAIGPGLVLLETQQNSDMTYRLYDYGRPRELHLEASFQAMRLETAAGKVASRPLPAAPNPSAPDPAASPVASTFTLLMESQYFRVDLSSVPLAAGRVTLPTATSLAKQPAVQLLFVSSGSGILSSDGCEPIRLRQGEFAMVPACVSTWQMEATGPMESTAPMEILRAIPG